VRAALQCRPFGRHTVTTQVFTFGFIYMPLPLFTKLHHQCLICLEVGDDLIDVHGSTKAYQHYYHEACLNEWFSRVSSVECPVCKTVVAVEADQKMGAGAVNFILKYMVSLCSKGDMKAVEHLFVNMDKNIALLEDTASVAELLMAACQSGHLEVVQFLTEKGADIQADNDSDD
jgi:hypothetical protein